jgi:rhodanese-related sulfurtransferase
MSLDISKITDYLYITTHATTADMAVFDKLNVGLVIHTTFFESPQESLVLSKYPMHNARMIDTGILNFPKKKLINSVNEALPIIEQGKSIVVYCKHGRHRSVAVACCILIAKGMSSGDAMALIKEKRPIADPYGSHVKRSIENFEKYWQSI